MYERLSDSENSYPDYCDGDPYNGDTCYGNDYAPNYYKAENAAYFDESDQLRAGSTPHPTQACFASETSLAGSEPLPLEPNPETPLRLLYAGPHFAMGGVEQHTLSLAKFLDPQRVRLTGYLITNAGKPAKTAPFPVRSSGPGELSQSVSDCDVLLLWGDAYNGRLTKSRPLCVYLAHGECGWTRRGLLGSNLVTDHVIAVSKRVADRVCGGFPTTTIANGVDSSRLGQTRSPAAVREQLGFSPGDFILGSVGRFSKEKRLEMLIEAVARLPRTFKLLLVGNGPRRAELLDLANDRIPGRYAFVKAHEYLGDYYRAMDAFCLASSNEGFALVVPEAMLCERPVIATNVGCVPEALQHQVSGLAVEHSAQAFAEAATRLHSHPDWARGMALEGRAVADRHFHAARMARDYENLLLRLHRNRSVARRGGS